MATHDSPAAVLEHVGAMAALRAATADCHARLDRRIDVRARLASVPAYLAFLGRLHGFHAPAEELLAVHAPELEGLDVAGRRRAALLDDDVRALGGVPGGARAPMPEIDSPDAALGMLYVLEGSTLGGAVIARMARERLGVTRERGASFLGAYGDAVGSRWRAFARAVEEHAPAGASAAMVAGAVGCFTAMEAWLCP